MSTKKEPKRGRGRPRVYDKSEVRMWVRCTPAELKAWRAHAKKTGRDVSKLARFLLNNDVAAANTR